MCLLLLRFSVGRTVWELGSVKVAHFSEMTQFYSSGSGSTPQHMATSSCLQTTAHIMAKLYRTPDTTEMLLADAGNPRLCK